MVTRNNILSKAIDECIKDLYRFAVPHIEWNDFLEENKEYSKKYKEWESSDRSENKLEVIGPAPYEFYYLPKDITKDIVDSYISAYKIDDHQNLLDIIEILKDYCKHPIVDKWIEGKDGNDPGHRGYEHPINLELELAAYLGDWHNEDESHEIAELIQNKFFNFLDMAGEFYNWNGELNSFSMSVYLGPSPNSNKNAVINNWKQYCNKDIEINEEQIKKDYYGDNDE